MIRDAFEHVSGVDSAGNIASLDSQETLTATEVEQSLAALTIDDSLPETPAKRPIDLDAEGSEDTKRPKVAPQPLPTPVRNGEGAREDQVRAEHWEDGQGWWNTGRSPSWSWDRSWSWDGQYKDWDWGSSEYHRKRPNTQEHFSGVYRWDSQESLQEMTQTFENTVEDRNHAGLKRSWPMNPDGEKVARTDHAEKAKEDAEKEQRTEEGSDKEL